MLERLCLAMLVNHVVSNDTHSAIFAAIFRYFERFRPRGARVRVSARPLPDADVHHYHRPHLEKSLLGCSAVTVHHDLRDTDSWLTLGKFLPRYREAARVICLNTTQAHLLAEEGIDHTVVIPHGFNDDVLKPRGALRTRDKLWLGFFSAHYLRRVKGEAYLFELAKHLDPADIGFVLVGKRRLQTAERLGTLGFEVRLFEYLPYRLFQNLYESIDVLLMCSLFEGGPANIPEAIATCTPVAATPVGFVPDFIEHGINGVILSGDAELDSLQVLRLADRGDPRYEELVEGMRATRTGAPTWKDVVERHFAVYAEMAR